MILKKNLINAQKSEIIFTSGATESNNFAIKSIANNYFENDCQIITATTEHKCVLESCHTLDQEGLKVHYLNVNDEGLVDLNELENLSSSISDHFYHPRGKKL